ncbi:MAG: hypothetical protein KA124_06320 [Luteimonas sp.]|nr:hypothetical protein [Luteimonas sp.]
MVGTVTGRRFEAPQRWLESTDIAESMVAFPCRSMILPAQVRCRRNQADIGPRLAATPDLRRMAASRTRLLSLSWEKNLFVACGVVAWRMPACPARCACNQRPILHRAMDARRRRARALPQCAPAT